jgi:ATP-binding protein involved in chromosome partitioning
MEVFGNGGGERLARESQVEFLGKIPMLSEVREGGDLGTPIILGYPESSAGIALANASERIAAAASVKSLIR